MTRRAGSLDTNALLRLLLNDIPAQRTAVKRLVEATSKQFAVADIAWFEVAFVLERQYQFDRSTIAGAIADFMAMPHFDCNRALFAAALELYVSHAALSLEDCALCAYARLNDALPLYTFDKKLANQSPVARLIAS